MKFALAAVCHYENIPLARIKLHWVNVYLPYKPQRILTHYRQRMVRSVDACNTFEMPLLSQYRLDIKRHRKNLTKRLSDPAITTETLLQTNTEFFTTMPIRYSKISSVANLNLCHQNIRLNRFYQRYCLLIFFSFIKRKRWI